jgi:hypothetical protein
MANTFLRKISNNISSVETSVGNYTVGGNVGAVVIGLSISNTNVSQVFANVIINNGTTDYYIIRNGLIPAAGALVVAGGEQKIILQTGDSVQVSASGNVDAVMNIMESSDVGLTIDDIIFEFTVEGDLGSQSGTEDLETGTGTVDLNA